jgi:protein O-GlcNAc transferase
MVRKIKEFFSKNFISFFLGFYYNMPLIPGCTQTSLFRSFQQYIIHRLHIPQLGPLKTNQIRITLLNRTTQYRQILNFNEIVEHLRNVSNNDYLINVVDYNINIPFIQQLNITHNTDIFMGKFFSKISKK